MACKLPTQLATPGKIHHHRKFTATSTTNPLSWRRILSPEPLLSLSTSFPSGKCNVKQHVKCSASGTAEATGAVNLGPGTPVRPTSILVVGATGTLGRQIVRRALDEGYDVRCLVRPRPAPADFLRDWGATVVNADLSKPETILATIVGVHTIIDCATGRPEEPIKTVLMSDIVFSVPMNGTYNLLGVDQKDIVTLEKYLQDYFTNILKKLKDLKAQSKQSDFYI